ncbi:hypothetical protein [Streptomyces sioyaensis]|uniref:hypothetical protein n=1 Tax=Streptomyces sioyaensis TaxID=67364 RepID=UPI00379173DE
MDHVTPNQVAEFADDHVTAEQVADFANRLEAAYVAQEIRQMVRSGNDATVA